MADDGDDDRLPDLRTRNGGPHPAALAFAERIAAAPVITADLPLRTTDPVAFAAGVEVLAAGLDAVVSGEPPGLDAALSPSHRATLIVEAGLPVIGGITCRDRNRVAIEGELAALADLGAAAVLCVTGDHPRDTVRPDARPVFDLDSTRTAALAHRAGHLVAVAANPADPPSALALPRLIEKVAAGAELCFLNLCTVTEAERFIAHARAAGVTVPFIASVPILTAPGQAERLATLPGISLADGAPEEIAHDLVALGVSGIHLSAITSPGATGADTARLIAETAIGLREELP